MRDAVPTVNNNPCQCTFLDGSRSPTGSKCKHSLNSDVKARNVECLEHNFGRVLSVLWCIERWLCQQEVMVSRFSTKVLEDALLQETLHQVPVLDDTMPNGILQYDEITMTLIVIREKLTFTE